MAIEIVDLPIQNGGSFHSYLSLPEGNVSYHPKTPFFRGNPWSNAPKIRRASTTRGRRFTFTGAGRCDSAGPASRTWKNRPIGILTSGYVKIAIENGPLK